MQNSKEKTRVKINKKFILSKYILSFVYLFFIYIYIYVCVCVCVCVLNRMKEK